MRKSWHTSARGAERAEMRTCGDERPSTVLFYVLALALLGTRPASADAASSIREPMPQKRGQCNGVTLNLVKVIGHTKQIESMNTSCSCHGYQM